MAWKPSKEQMRKYNKKYWRENAQSEKNRKLKSRYGLTLEDFNLMLEAQNRRCAICGESEAAAPRGILQVDHCHASGTVRHLLCASCNGGLGSFKDSPALLRAAADYIERLAGNSIVPQVAAQVLIALQETLEAT